VILVAGELGEQPQLAGREHQRATVGARQVLVGQDPERADDECIGRDVLRAHRRQC
jgi:hypothetical protein